MDEFELLKIALRDLGTADRTTAARILKYLTDWNNSRPLPAAGDK